MPDAVPSISEYIFTLSLSLNGRVWMISKKLNICWFVKIGGKCSTIVLCDCRGKMCFSYDIFSKECSMHRLSLYKLFLQCLCCAFSPRDLPVFCEWRDGLRLWSRLVVTRGDDLRSAARMGETLKLQFLCYRAAKTNSPPFIRSSFSSSTCCFSSFCHLVSLLEAVWHPRQ